MVAHHVSLIAVRAASAPYQIPDLSPAAKVALGEIAEQARTALDELRTVLGVLRSPEGLASHAPQPRLTDLPELLERMRASGMTVVVETDGAPRALSDPVELCCYRVIQETLTNAARHAPGEAGPDDRQLPPQRRRTCDRQRSHRRGRRRTRGARAWGLSACGSVSSPWAAPSRPSATQNGSESKQRSPPRRARQRVSPSRVGGS